MPNLEPSKHLPLPKPWSSQIHSVVLHVISLAQYALTQARGWAADSVNPRLRLSSEIERLETEVALLREEMRLKDARLARLPAARRPHYLPTERMAILELRAARGWSLSQAAAAFLASADTISSWVRRLDERGAAGLVQLSEPVNKFPDLVRYLVQRLKAVCPTLGKVKIAQILARAGLHLGVTTVGRILKEAPKSLPPTVAPPGPTTQVVTSKRPNHVWQVDLTVVPTSMGFWASWLPLSLPQCWPFCWWVAVVLDHYSRRAMGVTVFPALPTSLQVRSFLGRTIGTVGQSPKYIISDQGKQFQCQAFKRWCGRKGIRPRFGAIGQYGSITVIERFIQTLKNECTRRLLVPFRREAIRRELLLFVAWYNQHRPHMTLAGRTPDEAYFLCRPANTGPRYEPRPGWPRPAPCAIAQTLIQGAAGVRLEMELAFHGGRKHLPVVVLKRAA